MKRFAILVVAVALLAAASVSTGEVRVRMATTTSTENSGLLYDILPPFEKMFNARVDVIAVGTGKALKLGENGDVDVVLVHARAAEDAFVAAGHGVNRRDLMHNDFVIVGPKSDPAKIKDTKDAAQVLRKIAAAKTVFVSRGDDSGTHKKELSMWKDAAIIPSGTWYMESGQGMGPTLQVANEKQGYCLTDRGTYLAFKDKIQLTVLCEGDKRLFNPYGVIAVSPAAHPDVNYIYTMALIGWLTSSECQKMIGGYKKFGEVLFTPSAY